MYRYATRLSIQQYEGERNDPTIPATTDGLDNTMSIVDERLAYEGKITFHDWRKKINLYGTRLLVHEKVHKWMDVIIWRLWDMKWRI